MKLFNSTITAILFMHVIEIRSTKTLSEAVSMMKIQSYSFIVLLTVHETHTFSKYTF